MTISSIKQELDFLCVTNSQIQILYTKKKHFETKQKA